MVVDAKQAAAESDISRWARVIIISLSYLLKFEQDNNVDLPQDLLAFYQIHNGISITWDVAVKGAHTIHVFTLIIILFPLSQAKLSH